MPSESTDTFDNPAKNKTKTNKQAKNKKKKKTTKRQNDKTTKRQNKLGTMNQVTKCSYVPFVDGRKHDQGDQERHARATPFSQHP
jgi:hypothetical protein